jgi:hypothetical protein
MAYPHSDALMDPGMTPWCEAMLIVGAAYGAFVVLSFIFSLIKPLFSTLCKLRSFRRI